MPFDQSEDRLDKLISSNPLPTWGPIIALCVITLVSGLAWAFLTEIDEVTTAEGKIVPSGDIKVVQHLEGGIIQEIHVREGSQVKEGQSLLQLDVRSSGSKQDEIEVQLFSQMALRARLEAEVANRAPVFPDEIRALRGSNFVETQQRAFDARRSELDSALAVLRATLAQKEQEVKDLTSKLQTISGNFEVAKVRLDDSSRLLKDRLVSRDEYRKLEAEVEDLNSQRNSTRELIGKAEAAVREAQARMRERQDTFRREAQTELSNVIETVSKLREGLTATEERGARLEVKSPIDGIVKNLRYQTIGGVVRAGEPIMEIVPTGDRLVVSIKLDPRDRGFITEGQPAMVKVSTYDYARYGGLNGRVALLGADATIDEEEKAKGKAKPYFEVIVETEKNYLGKVEGELPITPGMQAQVDIHTGRKTVIDYVISPVVKMGSEAFRER